MGSGDGATAVLVLVGAGFSDEADMERSWVAEAGVAATVPVVLSNFLSAPVPAAVGRSGLVTSSKLDVSASEWSVSSLPASYLAAALAREDWASFIEGGGPALATGTSTGAGSAGAILVGVAATCGVMGSTGIEWRWSAGTWAGSESPS